MNARLREFKRAIKDSAEATDLLRAARQTGLTAELREWLNSRAEPPVLAWSESVDVRDMLESINFGTFDELSASRKAAWWHLVDFAKAGRLDATRPATRALLADIFQPGKDYTDAGQLTRMLEGAFTVRCTRAQAAAGGNSATTGAVTAIKRDFTGLVRQDDLDWLTGEKD